MQAFFCALMVYLEDISSFVFFKILTYVFLLDDIGLLLDIPFDLVVKVPCFKKH